MVFELSSEKRRFLELAMKEIDGKATSQERDELAVMKKANPDLEQHFSEIRREMNLAEGIDCFWETCLRVLLSGGTAEEKSRIRSYKETDPARWNKFLEIALSLQALGTSVDAPTTSQSSPRPMPKRVRNRLLSELGNKQKGN